MKIIGQKSMQFVQMNRNMANRVLENYFFNQFKRKSIHNDLGASFTEIKRTKNRITKQAHAKGEQKLTDEINWILAFRKRKLHTFKKHLPKVYRYSTSQAIPSSR